VSPETKQHDSLTLQEEFTLVGNDPKRPQSLRNFILRPRCKNATKASQMLSDQRRNAFRTKMLWIFPQTGIGVNRGPQIPLFGPLYEKMP
jgi:hypothetical protein